MIHISLYKVPNKSWKIYPNIFFNVHSHKMTDDWQMSIISDSRRPAGQTLGQVVVRLSALRFANCAPVACYGCADQALFQFSFLIYPFYYLFRSLTFQFDVKLVSSRFLWLVCYFQTPHFRQWLVNKTQDTFSFQRLFCRSSFLAKKKSIFCG